MSALNEVVIALNHTLLARRQAEVLPILVDPQGTHPSQMSAECAIIDIQLCSRAIRHMQKTLSGEYKKIVRKPS